MMREEKVFLRIKKILLFFSILFVLVTLYLLYFALFRAKPIADNPYNQRLTQDVDRITRGKIFDRNGELLASNNTDENGNPIRFYAYPRIYSHILGYSSKKYGKTGLERALNTTLLGIEDTPISEIMGWIENNSVGNDVALTIDTNAQMTAYNLLEGHIGAVVAMNPQTGEVYAMASRPTFNPNELENAWESYLEDESAPLLPRATQGLYTPGSVFKIITATALAENPSIDEHYTDSGELVVEGYTIRNYNEKSYGDVDLTDAIANSINTYFGQKALDLGGAKMDAVSKRFGFGAEIPFELPITPSVSGFSSSSKKIDIAQGGYGQGTTLVTPMEMALATSAIAAGGTMPVPTLVRAVMTSDGNVIRTMKPRTYTTVTDVRSAAKVTQAMEAMATNSYAAIPGVRVAGKSGTAETASGKTHAWFVAFAPVENPRVAVAVVLEEDGTFGAVTAAPIARELMQTVLNRIPEE